MVSESPSLDAAALRDFLEGRVARFWIPEYWVFADQIAKTSVGKIDKKALRTAREAGEFTIEYVK